MSEQPRRLQVLQAIVEDYVALREPVGSKALVERHGLEVSSATVRNDMAALEEEGLIIAPHTSAGRIPTDMGYRVFVDRLCEVKPLSAAERRAVNSLLEPEADMEEMMETTVRLLAQLTHQVAVAQFPHDDGSTVRHLELVGLAPGRVLVVLILSSGRVDQRVVSVDGAPDEAGLAALRTVLRQCVDDLTPAQAAAALDSAPERVPPQERPVLGTLVEAVRSLLQAGRQDRIVMAGTANLARSPGDFPDSIGPILEASRSRSCSCGCSQRWSRTCADSACGSARRIPGRSPMPRSWRPPTVPVRSPSSGSLAPRAWTIRAPWPPSGPSPATSRAFSPPERTPRARETPCPPSRRTTVPTSNKEVPPCQTITRRSA